MKLHVQNHTHSYICSRLINKQTYSSHTSVWTCTVIKIHEHLHVNTLSRGSGHKPICLYGPFSAFCINNSNFNAKWAIFLTFHLQCAHGPSPIFPIIAGEGKLKIGFPWQNTSFQMASLWKYFIISTLYIKPWTCYRSTSMIQLKEQPFDF